MRSPCATARQQGYRGHVKFRSPLSDYTCGSQRFGVKAEFGQDLIAVLAKCGSMPLHACRRSIKSGRRSWLPDSTRNRVFILGNHLIDLHLLVVEDFVALQHRRTRHPLGIGPFQPLGA